MSWAVLAVIFGVLSFMWLVIPVSFSVVVNIYFRRKEQSIMTLTRLAHDVGLDKIKTTIN